MKSIRYITMIASSLSFMFIAACGGSGSVSDNSTPNTTTNPTVQTTSFKVEYIPVTAAKEGKTTFKIKLTNRSDGSIAAGKSITLAPLMDMTSMSHSAPFDAPVDNSDGTYTSSIYYLMDGTWELKVTVGGETAIFSPAVLPSTGSNVSATLKGVTDQIPPMSGTTPVNRTYYLFNEGLSGGTFSLFIAAQDDGMMLSFPSVSAGSTLHDQNGVAWTVNTILVEASTDGGTTWITATPGSVTGHWSVAGLSGLASGGTINVRVTVNGEQKSKDGTAATPTSTNGSATFTIVAGS